jgi:hypothetical protein
MYQYPSGPVYGGSQYNPATGAESRDLRPLSSDDPRYSQRQPGMLGGTTNRPTNKLPPGYGQEPVIMDGDGGMRPPGYPPQTGGTTPLPFEGSDPVMFGPRGPHRIKNPPPTQNNDLGYIGGTPDFDETTGTYRDGRDTPGMMGTYDGRGPLLSADGPRSDYDPQQQMSRPSRQNRPLGGRYNGFGQQQQNPFMGGGGFGGFGQQQMNPFMGGGGFGGFGQQQMNPFMGGFGQQMNPFMGGGGFGGYGGFGQQQMNPFMGGGMGGFGQQQMNPFMGGGGFGGFGGMGGYGQQMQNPFMGGGGFGGFGQQTQNRSMQQQQPMQLPIQQPQQQQQPMGYQGGAF